MMRLTAWSADQLLQNELPPDCALIRFADHHDMLTPYKGEPADKLDVICMDVEDMPTLNSPNIANTKQIYDFVIRNQRRANMIAQCMAGIGRSRAVIAAVGKATGNDVRPILRMGTHNRSLYRKLLAHFGLAPDPEPRVFLAVRVKYAVDRLHAMILSLQRQRYDNWILLAHSDGPNKKMIELCDSIRATDKRVYYMETPTAHGYWGHKWRGQAILAGKAFSPAYVGISNDDNYYCPGYLEQMVGAMQDEGADLALCQCLHRYSGWNVVRPGEDLGCWLASSDLIRDAPWSGSHFKADVDHIARMKLAAKKVIEINKPLFIKN